MYDALKDRVEVASVSHVVEPRSYASATGNETELDGPLVERFRVGRRGGGRGRWEFRCRGGRVSVLLVDHEKRKERRKRNMLTADPDSLKGHTHVPQTPQATG